MRKVLFKIDWNGKDGCETSEIKLKKLADYKTLLIKDGEEIVEEKEVTNRRGKFIELTLK